MSARGLVGDPVVDNIDVLQVGLGEAALRVPHELLLALGAGDEVDQVAGLTVNTTVDLDGLTRHRGLAGVERVDVLTHVTVGLLTLLHPKDIEQSPGIS